MKNLFISTDEVYYPDEMTFSLETVITTYITTLYYALVSHIIIECFIVSLVLSFLYLTSYQHMK